MTHYADTLRDPHFNNIAAIVREPLRSQAWRQAHPICPFWQLHDDLVQTFLSKKLNREQIIAALTALVVALTEADERLRFSTDDLDWVVGVLDGDESDAKVTLAMLQAWWSAPDSYATPAEIAAATGTSESQWRNKAAAGEIPGARKAGKQWLLPVSVLRSRGIEIEYSRDDENDNDNDED